MTEALLDVIRSAPYSVRLALECKCPECGGCMTALQHELSEVHAWARSILREVPGV